MKILITSLKYPGKIGVSTYIDQLVKGLKQNGHHVELFCHTPAIKNFGKASPSQTEMIALYQNAAARLTFTNYDVIHAQGIIPSIATSRIKPPHIPLVTSLHGALAFNMLLNGKLNRNTSSWRQSLDIESKAISSSDICIVGSHWLKNLIWQEYKFPETQKFSIIPYGIDIDDFVQKMQLPPSTAAPENKYVIACTARLVPLKGHKFLLDSLYKLKQKREDWVCWLIGEGPLHNTLKQQAQRLKMGNKIYFLGNQKNVAALLKETDLFIFPSLQDNMPYAVMEAQIAGVPVVATDAGGIPEMVNSGETGLISPARNSDSLYQNINLLMENSALRSHLSANAKNWAIENWAIDKMIANTISVYIEALNMKS